MKGTRQLSLLLGLFLALIEAAPALALPPFSEYGPACQWVRLFGELKRPSGMAADEPLLLTLTYQLPKQDSPYTLMTNKPVSGETFSFVLSGFRERIDGAYFVPPGFYFSKKIVFRYYATSVDRQWHSGWRKSVYRPEQVKKDGNVYCKTAIALDPLTLEAR